MEHDYSLQQDIWLKEEPLPNEKSLFNTDIYLDKDLKSQRVWKTEGIDMAIKENSSLLGVYHCRCQENPGLEYHINFPCVT